MNLAQNTVLITGGASGIGWAFAERFLKAGSEVIICGRRADKLEEVKKQYPQVHTRVCDVGQEKDRIDLYGWVTENFPQVNVLVNNAGIQRRVSFTQNEEPWSSHQSEMAINLEAPVHLALLFIPHLKQKSEAYLINVTSGLAFVPMAKAAVYSATKAALHSFTLSLRYQLKQTSVKVIEVVPPAVNTDLGGPGLHTFGAPLADFADAVMERLGKGEEEIGYGTSEFSRQASRQELQEIFKRMNP
ncbi:short-chain dehydrogenase [Adhaeribacter aerolatus]|uniref:Short-chain dehydrogenase n=1 Tax=Adhaeribacter aerolatus TaxID=670289 RepID=A0A512AYM1_9BACT|nr:SDR family oxidoreductase [Adhaeribacter aerolatus]GEO04822.1 short-chain dehydrogenase [Adhaeribacter aerolatus]